MMKSYTPQQRKNKELYSNLLICYHAQKQVLYSDLRRYFGIFGAPSVRLCIGTCSYDEINIVAVQKLENDRFIKWNILFFSSKVLQLNRCKI